MPGSALPVKPAAPLGRPGYVAGMVIDFWFDVVCPFAYLASTRVEALAAEAGAVVRWRPILLGGVLKSVGSDPFPMSSMSPARLRLTRADMVRQAAWLGEPLSIPAEHPRRTLDAMRVLASAPPERVPAAARALFRAYWVEGRDVSDRATLTAIVAPLGLDAEGILAEPEAKDRLRQVTDEAVAGGVFGVPTIRVGERQWWGVDRLHFVRRALGLPDAPAPEARGAGPRRLELLYDFSSPFAYLASTQAERVAAEAGAELVTTPILLGALFRDLGTPMVPLLSFAEARRRFMERDLSEWAAWWGVPFRFATTFPLRTVLPLRVALVEPAVRAPVFRAAWVDDRDIGNPDVLRGVLDDAGFDGAHLLAAAEDPAVKARLKAHTDRARELGAIGVPTFLVGDEPWWGQDRLPMVAASLRGFRFPALC